MKKKYNIVVNMQPMSMNSASDIHRVSFLKLSYLA